ncbi:MAG TPA: hypothetical protein VKF40_26380 [Burkholderiales bacterium]|nr:hypothetical protein [Burkholderiales bacterium]
MSADNFHPLRRRFCSTFVRDRLRCIAARLLCVQLGLALSGCVTINVYFPAAAAEKAADRIIDEVWQLKEGGAPATVKPAPGESK